MGSLVHIGLRLDQDTGALDAVLTRCEHQRRQTATILIRLTSEGGERSGGIGLCLQVFDLGARRTRGSARRGSWRSALCGPVPATGSPLTLSLPPCAEG